MLKSIFGKPGIPGHLSACEGINAKRSASRSVAGSGISGWCEYFTEYGEIVPWVLRNSRETLAPSGFKAEFYFAKATADEGDDLMFSSIRYFLYV